MSTIKFKQKCKNCKKFFMIEKSRYEKETKPKIVYCEKCAKLKSKRVTK